MLRQCYLSHPRRTFAARRPVINYASTTARTLFFRWYRFPRMGPKFFLHTTYIRQLSYRVPQRPLPYYNVEKLGKDWAI